MGEGAQAYPVVTIRETDYTKVILVDDSADDPAGASHFYEVQSVKGVAFSEETRTLGVVKFQRGPIKERGVNGVQNEDLLAIVIDRLKHFQRGPYKCYDNEVAMEYCQLALRQLNKRTADRQSRGVEGTIMAPCFVCEGSKYEEKASGSTGASNQEDLMGQGLIGAEPSKRPDMDIALDELVCAVDSVEKKVALLSERLNPVLSPHYPQEKDDRNAESSPVVNSIRGISERIGRVCQMADNIHRRLTV